MPWGRAPIGRLLFNNVVNEAGQLGPQRPALPKEAVDRDGEGETDDRTKKASWNDRGDRKADVWSKVEVESLTCEEDGNFGAEDNTSNGEESKSELVTSPAGSRRWTSTCMREEATHGESR